MPVRFILGRAGTGKTHVCFERIKEMLRENPLDPPIYWLLPKQATFNIERQLTCKLGGFSRVRIVSFDQLGKDILTDCGDVGIPEVDTVSRRMIVGHLLRKHQDKLRFYSASARRPGLAAELDATFGEFERAGLDAPLLGEVLNTLDADDDAGFSLRDKLHDVQFLLSAYDAYIGQDRLDPQRRLKLILDRVGGCSLLKRATIFIDDFYDFTGYETKLLAAIAVVAQHTDIALLIDPESPVAQSPQADLDELSTFHRTERTYASLHRALGDAGAKIEPPLVLHETKRFASPSLGLIERQLFNQEHTPPAQSESEIEFLEAADARTEVDAVARRIRRALREDGLRLRDVAVLTRSLPKYQELIEASFQEHQFIPYFVDRRRTAAHHPLLQFARSVLLIARHGWPHDAMMTLLKTGLAEVSEDDADELENYVLQHRIRGTMWTSPQPWGFKRELIRGESDEPLPAKLTEASRIDAVRRTVTDNLQPFVISVRGEQPLPIREIVTQLFTLMERFHLRRTIAAWMREAEAAGEYERRDEHEQIWTELAGLFQKMVSLLGDEAITLGDFLEILDSGLESFDLAITPPTVDQVLVGQLDRSRLPAVKLTLVLGLNEGDFPLVEREGCVLSDRERRSLRKRKIDLDPETDRALLDERLLAYIAFTRASQRLVVSRCLSDASGRPSHPSLFWNELRRLFPTAIVQQFARPSQSDPNGIGTPRQLVTALMRWVQRGGETSNAASPWPALYQWLATYNEWDDAIDVMRFRSWKALVYANTAALSPELAAKLFPTPLESTVRRLETFAACPFQHFLKYGLRLRDREEPDVTAIDLSNAYHRVLEDLLGGILASKQDWCDMDAQATADLVRTHVAEVGRTLRNELMLSNARNRYLLDRIEQTLAAVIEAQREMHRRGKYRPKFASLRFGGEGASLPAHRVPTPKGNDLHLTGQIDRVDLHERGGAFTIADYKLGAPALALDHVFYGLSLQLLTYLIVMQAAGEQLVGRKLTPAAAFFLQLLRSPQSVDHPEEGMAPDHPDFHLRVKPRGIIDARAIQSFDKALAEGASSVINIRLKKDGQLGWRNTSDAVDEFEFAAILKHVEKKLGELADRLVAGDVRIEPYYLNRETPCPKCEFRSVCRFEPGINKYTMLQGMKREDVLMNLTGGELHGE